MLKVGRTGATNGRRVLTLAILPLALGSLLLIIANNPCMKKCKELNFYTFFEIPISKTNFEYKCYCQTESESKSKNTFELGTRVL